MTNGYVEFEFDLPDALFSSLVMVLDNLPSAPLTQDYLATIPEAQGVYQLLLRGDVVYVGKTDAEAGLKNRLERHARTIRFRQNLHAGDVTFKAVRVFVFTTMDLETQLIKHYETHGAVSWNNSGFGSNDPGRNRDKTEVKNEGFDAQFPIDLDRDVKLELPKKCSAADALAALKAYLPYIFRFEGAAPRSRAPHPQLRETIVRVPVGAIPTRAFVTQIVQQLPGGWQATALPGRLLLYKENTSYDFGQIIARS